MSTISTTEQPETTQINLMTLSIPQLTALKKQLDSEITVYQDSLSTLKVAQTKFQSSAECLEKLTDNFEGKEVLVPLTASMYVLGKMRDVDHVIVDIGTKYLAEKNMKEAKEYFERKVKFVTENMERIQYLGLEKSKVRDAIVEVMEIKLQPQAS